MDIALNFEESFEVRIKGEKKINKRTTILQFDYALHPTVIFATAAFTLLIPIAIFNWISSSS